MKLVHYSETPFELDRTKSYKDANDIHNNPLKPRGLWLSDDSQELNWPSWCRSEDWRTYALRFGTEFKLKSSANVLILKDPTDVRDFIDVYTNEGSHSWSPPNWKLVSEVWDGIFITPYTRSFIMGWYLSWDVSSGCVWNLDILEEVQRFEQVMLSDSQIIKGEN